MIMSGDHPPHGCLGRRIWSNAILSCLCTVQSQSKWHRLEQGELSGGIWGDIILVCALSVA